MVVPRLTGFTLACLALVLITAVGASAVTIYTTPSSDGYVFYHYWDVASQGANAVGDYAYVIDGEHLGGSTYERWIGKGIFQFPISSLSGVTLSPNSVKLHVYFQPNTTVSSVQLSGFNYDGGGTIVYSQTSGARTFICSMVPTASTWWQVDVTADLQRQINAGYNWAGFYFTTPYDEAVLGWKSARISTYEDGAHRPYLDVVPEPSSLLALGSGLIALCGALRKRK